MSDHGFICFAKVAISSQNPKWEDFWLQVRGFWLEITEKIGQPCSFFLPLDLVNLSGGFQETSIQNSISISLAPRAGGFHLFLQSPNRCDVIHLFNALEAGRARLAKALDTADIPRAYECDVETVSAFFGIGKSKLHLCENSAAFELAGAKGGQRYAFEDVQSVHARLNHASSHARVVLNVKENGSLVAKEYNCIEHEHLMNIIQCFLMNSFAWARENAGPPIPDEPMSVLALS
jgi:hypothetical protein